MKVYAVSSGEYSDWHIDELFLKEEDAAEFAKQMNEGKDSLYGDEYGVDEWEVLESVPKVQITYVITAELHFNGKMGQPRCTTEVEYVTEHDPKPLLHKGLLEIKYYKFPTLKFGNLVISGPDNKQVYKVFSEKVAAFKSKQWIPQEDDIEPRL